MATISLNDTGKAVGEPVHISLAEAEFDLEGTGTYETDNRATISDAQSHPWLSVEVVSDSSGDEEAAAKRAEEAANSTDPFVNPRADHLRDEADPEVVEAARRENDRIRRVHAGEEDAEPGTPITPVVPDSNPDTPVNPAAPAPFGTTRESTDKTSKTKGDTE
jgi:hypothetical protein